MMTDGAESKPGSEDSRTYPAGHQFQSVGLTDWLAQRDVPCPGCGYNLRGVSADKCPECGVPLELELRRRRPTAGWGALLLLVFGWLLLAGGLNTARNVRDLLQSQQQNTAVQQRLAAMRAQIVARLKQLQADASAEDGALARSDDGFPGSDMMRQMRKQMQLDMQAMQQSALQAQMAAIPASTAPAPTLGMVWRTSGWRMKVGSVGFAALSLCGAIGLVALLLARVRRWPESRVRVLAAVGLIMFGAYAAWHVTLFVSEFR